MNEQQESFPLPDKRQFKSDQLSEDSLRFKLANLEREILRLNSENSALKKTLDTISQDQVSELEKGELLNVEQADNKTETSISSFTQVSWGARYKSRNDEVQDIEIPALAEPDHIYTKDSMDFVIVKACECKEIQSVKRTKIKASDDLITRKLILTREKSLHFECGSCDKPAHHKQIEKHIEAELYCKRD